MAQSHLNNQSSLFHIKFCFNLWLFALTQNKIDLAIQPLNQQDWIWKYARTIKASMRFQSLYSALSSSDSYSEWEMSGVLYEEIFDIKSVDPEGKQFERVQRIHAECEEQCKKY